MKKTALIIGIGGQDGALLAKLLLKKNYIVIGTSNNTCNSGIINLKKLNIKKSLKIFKYSMGNMRQLMNVIKSTNPDEIYMFAGFSKTNNSILKSKKILMTYIKSTIDLLNINLKVDKKKKIFFSCSSEIFQKKNNINFLDETSRCEPDNPYGLAMLNVLNISNIYREYYDMFISVGIFFNHESFLRPKSFLSKKITHNLVKFYYKNQSFKIGNMNGKRDWSDAEDIVKGAYLSMQKAKSDNYIFASGKLHTVRDFIKTACNIIGIKTYFKGKGLNEKCYCAKTKKLIAECDIKHYRLKENKYNIGNSMKAKKILGWNTKITFKSMIKNMIKYDIHNLKKKNEKKNFSNRK